MSCGGSWCWDGVAPFLGDVVAPDLDLTPGATPADHAAQLGDGDVVVGHSYGSLPAHVAAPRFGALVVIDGFAPDSGDSAHGLKPEFAAARRAQGEAWLPDDPLPRMRPMPLSAMETPVEVGPLPERRVFVHCLRSDFAMQAARAQERGFAIAQVDDGHLWPLEQPVACAALLLAAAAPPLPRDERCAAGARMTSTRSSRRATSPTSSAGRGCPGRTRARTRRSGSSWRRSSGCGARRCRAASRMRRPARSWARWASTPSI
jgi:hypothetical protein